MTKKYVGTWSPDTCKCVIEQILDDDTKELSFNFIKTCPAHTGRTPNQVVEENRLKNRVPEQIRKTITPTKMVNYKWSFDDERQLQVEFETLDVTDREAAAIELQLLPLGLSIEKGSAISPEVKNLIEKVHNAKFSMPKAQHIAAVKKILDTTFGVNRVRVT